MISNTLHIIPNTHFTIHNYTLYIVNITFGGRKELPGINSTKWYTLGIKLYHCRLMRCFCQNYISIIYKSNINFLFLLSRQWQTTIIIFSVYLWREWLICTSSVCMHKCKHVHANVYMIWTGVNFCVYRKLFSLENILNGKMIFVTFISKHY